MNGGKGVNEGGIEHKSMIKNEPKKNYAGHLQNSRFLSPFAANGLGPCGTIRLTTIFSSLNLLLLSFLT